MGISSSQTWNPRFTLSILLKTTQLGIYHKSAFNREPVGLYTVPFLPKTGHLAREEVLGVQWHYTWTMDCEFESWLNHLGVEPS